MRQIIIDSLKSINKMNGMLLLRVRFDLINKTDISDEEKKVVVAIETELKRRDKADIK